MFISQKLGFKITRENCICPSMPNHLNMPKTQILGALLTAKELTNLVGGREKRPMNMIIPYMEGPMSSRIWDHVTWLLN